MSLGVVLSMALVQAGAVIDVDGIDRDLHVRVTRVGAQRLDTDSSHVAGDVEGAALSVAEQAAADQGLAMAAVPDRCWSRLAPPTTFLWLVDTAPAAPTSHGPTACLRDRAPPVL